MSQRCVCVCEYYTCALLPPGASCRHWSPYPGQASHPVAPGIHWAEHSSCLSIHPSLVLLLQWYGDACLALLTGFPPTLWCGLLRLTPTNTHTVYPTMSITTISMRFLCRWSVCSTCFCRAFSWYPRLSILIRDSCSSSLAVLTALSFISDDTLALSS